MEMNNTPKWRLVNLTATLFVVMCTLVSTIPARPLWFGFVTDQNMQTALSVLAGIAIYRLTKGYVAAIESYTPSTPLQAKRANEQIKLTANFANTIAAAWIGVVALSQLIKKEPDFFVISITVMISGFIHGGARNMVGLVKDEALQPLPIED
jgi:hypothetical protein